MLAGKEKEEKSKRVSKKMNGRMTRKGERCGPSQESSSADWKTGSSSEAGQVKRKKMNYKRNPNILVP